MDSGVRALGSGCIAFIVATIAILLFNSDRNCIDVLTIGDLTGGIVALNVWITTEHRKSDVSR